MNVTRQREFALRLRLQQLSRQTEAARQELAQRKHSLDSLLSDLGKEDVAERLARQELFMAFSAVCRAQFDRLTKKIEELEAKRAETIARLKETKARTETLDRLRQEAFEAHMKEQLKLEQQQFDQSAQITFAGKMIAESKTVNQ